MGSCIYGFQQVLGTFSDICLEQLHMTADAYEDGPKHGGLSEISEPVSGCLCLPVLGLPGILDSFEIRPIILLPFPGF